MAMPSPLIEADEHWFTITFKRTVEKSSVKSSVKIVEFIREDKYVTIPVIAENLGLTTRAIEKQIGKLQVDGIICRIGPDKGGHWEIIENDNKEN